MLNANYDASRRAVDPQRLLCFYRTLMSLPLAIGFTTGHVGLVANATARTIIDMESSWLYRHATASAWRI